MVKAMEYFQKINEIVSYVWTKVDRHNIDILISDLPKEIIEIGPKYILQRDLESLAYYCETLIEPENLKHGRWSLARPIISDLVERNYPTIEKDKARDKINLIAKYVSLILRENNKITPQAVELIHKAAKNIQPHNWERTKLYSKIALSLKWLQYPCMNRQLSKELNEYVNDLGNKFGKYYEKEITELKKYWTDPFQISEKDREILTRDTLLSASMIECNRRLEDEISKLDIFQKRNIYVPEKSAFKIFLDSLEELKNYTLKKSDKNEIEIFEDVTLSAIFLIFFQDPNIPKSRSFVHFIKKYRDDYVNYKI